MSWLVTYENGEVTRAPDAAGWGLISTASGEFRCRFPNTAREKDRIVVSIRPETIRLLPQISDSQFSSDNNVLLGNVRERIFLGESIDYVISVGHVEYKVRSGPEPNFTAGASVQAVIRPADCRALTNA